MKKYLKGILFIVGAIILVVIGLAIKNTDFSGYAVLCFTGAAILVVFGGFSLFASNDPTKVYESKVKNILNTYDSILVKSNTIPSLEGRNVVNVEKMEDLVDAQLELRKPICYLKQTESCSFILLDEKEAFVYVEKLNDDVVTPVEIELKELKIKEKDKDDMDSEMLKAIDKTTVVKLSNRKSYKVSPIRKKPMEETPVEEKVEEENVQAPPVEEPKFQVVTEDIPEVPQPTEEKAEEKVSEETKGFKIKVDDEII
ncbi:MAG: hypothetical protein IJI58_03290 [Bacilli bacterium]|nr:hypothetical protein [Bacilli bacterium]